MEIDREFWATLFFTILNILILFFILKKLLFKPVTKFMDGRVNKINEALEMAKEAQNKIEKMEEEHNQRMKEIKEEGKALIDSYEKKAKKEYDRVILQAKEDADALIQNTRNELEVEKKQLVASLKGEISELVLEASKKVLNKNLDSKTNRQLIDDFIKESK